MCSAGCIRPLTRCRSGNRSVSVHCACVHVCVRERGSGCGRGVCTMPATVCVGVVHGPVHPALSFAPSGCSHVTCRAAAAAVRCNGCWLHLRAVGYICGCSIFGACRCQVCLCRSAVTRRSAREGCACELLLPAHSRRCNTNRCYHTASRHRAILTPLYMMGTTLLSLTACACVPLRVRSQRFGMSTPKTSCRRT